MKIIQLIQQDVLGYKSINTIRQHLREELNIELSQSETYIWRKKLEREAEK